MGIENCRFPIAMKSISKVYGKLGNSPVTHASGLYLSILVWFITACQFSFKLAACRFRYIDWKYAYAD